MAWIVACIDVQFNPSQKNIFEENQENTGTLYM